jgi:hypothetical protein
VVVEEATRLLLRACHMVTLTIYLGRPTMELMAFLRSTGEKVGEVDKVDVGGVVMVVEGVAALLVEFRCCRKDDGDTIDAEKTLDSSSDPVMINHWNSVHSKCRKGRLHVHRMIKLMSTWSLGLARMKGHRYAWYLL